MASQFRNLFPSIVCEGSLPNSTAFNKVLLKEIQELSSQDTLGKQWSEQNYHGGYTSYASLSDLQYRTKGFSRFAELMLPYAQKFVKAQAWESRGLSLRMNACWMNIMSKYTSHSSHIHPHSVISGAYFVSTPEGSVPLKLEDPRMSLYMHAPVRNTPLNYSVTARAGTFVLFESWMRHEVPPNLSNKPRISISFNYSLEADE